MIFVLWVVALGGYLLLHARRRPLSILGPKPLVDCPDTLPASLANSSAAPSPVPVTPSPVPMKMVSVVSLVDCPDILPVSLSNSSAAPSSVPVTPGMVSVVIPAHKFTSASVLGSQDAILSVLEQSYANVEAIFVDSSPDGKLIRELEPRFASHPRKDSLVFVRGKPNTRAGFGRNLGVKYSRGEFVGFLDCDDAYVESKLAKQMAWAKWMGLEDFSGSDSYVGKCRDTEKGARWNTTHPETNGFPLYNGGKYKEYYAKQRKAPFDGSNLLAKWNLAWLEVHNSAITSTVVMSKALFYSLCGFNEKLPAGQEDIDLWKRALKKIPYMGYLGVPLVIYDDCHSSRNE